MAKIRVSDETPIGMAAMQAHTIAATNWPDDEQTEVLEGVVKQIGETLHDNKQSAIIVTLPDNLYNSAIKALSTLKQREIADFQRETFEMTRTLLREAESHASIVSD